MTATVAGIHLGLDTHANRPAANTVPDGSLYSCSTHSLVYKSNYAGNSWATWATLGSGVALTVSENFITGDTTMTNANTFYDGPSLSLAAGTYLLDSVITLDSTTAHWFTAKIWDGSTLMSASPSEYNSTNGGGIALAIHGYVVLGSTTTVKVSAACDGTGGKIRATDPAGNGTTNKASYLRATKIA